MCKKKLKKWKLKREKRKKEMLKITESANVAHYVGCDWVENSDIDFAAIFFRSTINSRILNTNTKRKEQKR